MKVKVTAAAKRQDRPSGCLICGKELVYADKTRVRACDVCGAAAPSSAVCEGGHFVCDGCHRSAAPGLLSFLTKAAQKDPILLLEGLMGHPSVHLHGPEHHYLVPWTLLAAFRNCGGVVDLPAALREAAARGGQVPGGTCGHWGACGAAVGAGIFASIALGSHPLNARAWPFPNLLTARCLERMAEIGGPRCCKRTSYIAVETAAAFSREYLGVPMAASRPVCRYSGQNRQCIRGGCPYYAT